MKTLFILLAICIITVSTQEHRCKVDSDCAPGEKCYQLNDGRQICYKPCKEDKDCPPDFKCMPDGSCLVSFLIFV